jgi:magnesium and cobalt transporter
MTPQDPKPQKDSPPFFTWLRGIIRGYKTDSSLRDALEEYIQATPEEGTADLTLHERLMLANVLKMRDLRVVDVMIPRADILAVDVNTNRNMFFELLAQKQFSRLPVFRQTLDDVVGTIHIKDVLAHLAQHKEFTILELVRPVPLVSPSLPVSDLIMQMRESRKHMVMVVDEYGGIDGLVTIGDVIETIFGQIADEYDIGSDELVNPRPDGTFVIDTRLTLTEFESRFGSYFNTDEHNENDTIGGLIFSLAGRVPTRGEIIKHPHNPLRFEVIDGDARRIYHVRINLPPATSTAPETAP